MNSGGASVFVAGGEEGELPVWVELAPLTVTIIGFLIAFYYYILHPDAAARSSPTAGACSTCSSTTNGISTSCTTSCSCARPSEAGPLPVEARRRHGDRRAGPGRHRRPGAGCGARRGAAADRLCLSLCPGDAAGRGGAGHLVHGRREARCEPSLLSLVTFVPLLGAAGHPADAAGQQRRAGSRWAPPSSSSSLSLVVWAGFDPANPGFQLVEKHELAGRRHLLSHGRGRHFHAVRGADRGPDALLHRRQLGKRSRPASPNTWSPSWCWKP